jgi:hypothetical protein
MVEPAQLVLLEEMVVQVSGLTFYNKIV